MFTKIRFTLLTITFFTFQLFGAYNPKELNIVFRQIGHRLLESAGDTTSRVLPVESKKENTFVISFDKHLYVSSDSLYKIIEFELGRVGIRDFVTELKECSSDKVFLAFLYSEAMDSITPCNGREIPVGCYKIEISILKKGNNYWLLIITTSFLFILLSYLYLRKKGRNKESDDENAQLLPIGSYYYDVRNRQLKHELQTENLTEKEAKLMSLLVAGINEIQNRDFLMNEIWTDGGIFVVSKNLDVLISKLRKKLRHDERIRITNIHGVGYKLELP